MLSLRTPLRPFVVPALCAFLLSACSLVAAMREVPHPFLLWTKADAEAIRKRIESDPAAKEQLARMIARDSKAGGKSGGNVPLLNLFKYSVLGDEQAGETEKEELLKFIGTVPEPMTVSYTHLTLPTKRIV